MIKIKDNGIICKKVNNKNYDFVATANDSYSTTINKNFYTSTMTYHTNLLLSTLQI